MLHYHSWGGFLAMQYAVAHPEHVSKLILSNSMPATSEEYGLFLQEWLTRMAPIQEIIAAMKMTQEFQEGDPETVEAYYRLMFRHYCFDPEDADDLSLRMTSEAFLKGAKVYECLRQNVFDLHFNLHAALQKLKVPVLIIHGDTDPVPYTIAENLHRTLAGSKYVLIEKCGHFPYVEKPEVYFPCLFEFLK